MHRKSQHENTAGVNAKALIAGHEAPLLRYAMVMLDDSGMAQDAVEQAFKEVIKNRRAGLEDPGAELYRAVHEAAAALINCRKARSGGGTTRDGGVMNALRMLAPDEQQVVILKIFERMTNREISRITQKHEEKVATLVYKSVIKVAGELKKAGLL